MVHYSKLASVKKEIYLYYLVTTFALKKMKEHREESAFSFVRFGWMIEIRNISPHPDFSLCTAVCRTDERQEE